MRKVYVILCGFIVFATNIFCQGYYENIMPVKDGKILYQEVVNVDSTLSKDQLYINAKEFFTKTFRDADAVIQLDDKASGVIMGKSFVKKGHNTAIKNPKNWFTLKIECKDGRYRYTLTDIIYEFDISVYDVSSHNQKAFEDFAKPSGNKMSEKKRQAINDAMEKYCRELNAEFEAVITDMKSGMSVVADDSW